MDVWPGDVMEIMPPQAQVHLHASCSAGLKPIIIEVDPGAQGAGITGTHGIGVSTPNAAAVAEATVGLEIDEHMPKGGMFLIGMLSMMVAAGTPTIVWFSGVTINALGATPNVQVIIAPAVTSLGMGPVS